MTWPNDPNGSLVPILEASVAAAASRHPSASGGTPGVILTATDRCDRCPAAAVYRVARNEGQAISPLDFCLHHWRKHMPAMDGWVTIGANPGLAATGGGSVP